MTPYSNDSNTDNSQLQALLNAAMNSDDDDAKSDAAAAGNANKGTADKAAAKSDKGSSDTATTHGSTTKTASHKPDGAGATTTGDSSAKAKKEEAAKKDDADDGPLKSFTQMVRERAIEGDSRPTATLTLRKIIGGDILNTEVVRRQIGVFILITLFIIVYITNRYACQRNLVKIDKLTRELKDAKYRALSSNSELTEKSRESRVLEMLHNCKDSTLHIASQPPFIINVPTADDK